MRLRVWNGDPSAAVTVEATSLADAAERHARARHAACLDHEWPVELTVSDGQIEIQYLVTKCGDSFVADKKGAR